MSWVTQHRNSPSWQIDDLRFAQRIFGVAQIDPLGVLQGVWCRSRGGGRWRRLGGGSWGCSGGQHTQDTLVTGGIRAIGQLQVTHLLIQHPDLVDLVDLSRETSERGNSLAEL